MVKRLKAAHTVEVLRPTPGGGQRPVKSGIPDQWSRNNGIVRRKRAASTPAMPLSLLLCPHCSALGPEAWSYAHYRGAHQENVPGRPWECSIASRSSSHFPPNDFKSMSGGHRSVGKTRGNCIPIDLVRSKGSIPTANLPNFSLSRHKSRLSISALWSFPSPKSCILYIYVCRWQCFPSHVSPFLRPSPSFSTLPLSFEKKPVCHDVL